ncbi:MAG: glycosyltransferase family 4 protein [Victivallales bacterium]|jgi:glycosyltransferase involved in cell wall biosynthesis|nr:glycosyltransferase family 4 protein [Victivallales bacterium]
MLKVAQVVRRFSFDEWGGTENVVWNSTLALRPLGVESEILATSALSQPGEEVRDGVKIRKFRYFYPYFPMSRRDQMALDKKGGSPYAPKLYRALLNGKYDLIHIHSGGRIAEMAIAAARKCRIPCILSLHGGFADVPKQEMAEMLAPLRHKFNYGGIIDRLTGRHCMPEREVDALICVGQNEFRLLSSFRADRKILYLPNGVDVNKFAAEPKLTTPVREEWGIPAERKVLLCISRIDYQKNQKMLISFLRQLISRGENVHLLLIGPVTAAWYANELVQEAHHLRVDDRLTLIPGLSPDDPRLVGALKTADCFILPSLHEPFGIVVLEAWAAGIPVIAANVGGLKKLIQDGYTGLHFLPHIPETLLNAYSKIESDEELRKTLIRYGRQEVECYSWAIIAKELKNLYDGLCHV